MIELENVGKQYNGTFTLKGVNLRVAHGEVLAVIGPTGAGKTTLIRMVDMLDEPTSGRIRIDGIDVTRSRRARLAMRRRMAFVQQKPIVFSMSVYDNVACGLRWRGESKNIIRHKVASALELVGMTDYQNRDARTLSGGETQRVALARALVTKPEILLLDEPTANLDPVSITRIEEVLAYIIREEKLTLIMATHDMIQGQRFASTIGVLVNGEMLQMGTSEEVFNSPRSKEVAEFVGVENILPGIVSAKDDYLAVINVDGNAIQAISDLPLETSVYAIVRPEDVIVTLPTFARDASSARNMFEGQICSMTLLGPRTRIQIDCGFPLLAVLTSRSVQELDITVGKHVIASFKAAATHIIRR